METCFDDIRFNNIQVALEEYRLNANVRKDIPTANIEVIKTVASNHATGLGALIVPIKEHKDIRYKAYWQSVKTTKPTDAGSYGQSGGLTCDVPMGEKMQEKSVEFDLPFEIVSEPILIDENDYLSKPFALENDLVKMIAERIISLENRANQDALKFLYENRGVNEHENPDYVKIQGRDTLFGNGKIGDPNNMGYLMDFMDMNDIPLGQVIDGGALHLPIWEASKNASDDDKRSQEQKFNEMTQGRFSGYSRDMRGLGRFLRAKNINKGFMVLQKGVVSALFRHYEPALVNPSMLSSRESLFSALGIGDYAQQFGQQAAMHNVGKHKFGYSIPSFNLTQNYVNPATGVITNVPVYIDVEHDIDCLRKDGRGRRTRVHKIQLFLRYGFLMSPTDQRPSNTGIYLFREDCNFTPKGFCVENPCDAIASLGMNWDETAAGLTFAKNPIFEVAMPGTDETLSGKSITKQEISVYIGKSGSKKYQLVKMLDNADLQTAQSVQLEPNEKYYVFAKAWFYMGEGSELCVKEAEACVMTKGAESLCGAIDVDFDTSVAGEVNTSISLTGQSLNLGASLSDYMLSVKDSDGVTHAIGAGNAIADFPLDFPGTIATGEATIKGYMQVGDCKVDISETIVVTAATAPLAASNTFTGLAVGTKANLDILDNDQFSCDAADVEVKIVTATTKGTITEADDLATINTDGGIDYTPTESGEDTFSYQIRCSGQEWSNIVEVSLGIE